MYKYLIKTGAVLLITLTMVGVSLGGTVKKGFNLYTETVINGTVIKAGDYMIEFSESEDSEAIIRKGNKVIVKVPYKLAKLAEKSSYTAVRMSSKESGKPQTLISLLVAGQTYQLDFAEDTKASHKN